MGPRDRLPLARRDPGVPSRSTGFRVAGPRPRPLERTTGHGPRGVLPHRPRGPSDPASRYAGGVADLGGRGPLGPRVRGRPSLRGPGLRNRVRGLRPDRVDRWNPRGSSRSLNLAGKRRGGYRSALLPGFSVSSLSRSRVVASVTPATTPSIERPRIRFLFTALR